MIVDTLRSKVPESLCATPSEARKKIERGGPATRTDEMPLDSSASLCDTALKVLGRDSQLRRAYVQCRWQGLVPHKPVTAATRSLCMSDLA